MCARIVVIRDKTLPEIEAKPPSRGWLNWRQGLQRVREPENQNSVALVFVGLFLGFWVAHHYALGLPGIIARLNGYPENPAWQVEADKRDPQVGQTLQVPALLTLEGQKVTLPQRQGLTVLAFTGNCAACATRDNMLSAETLSRDFPQAKVYVVIMAGDKAAARSIWQNSQLKVPLLVDSDGEAAVHLNAVFNFRYYVFAPQGKLLYLSQRKQSSEQVRHDLDQVLAAS